MCKYKLKVYDNVKLMSTNGFKPKTNKKIKVEKNSTITLDNKHNEVIDDFHKDDTERIPSLRNKKSQLYDSLNNRAMSLEEKMNTHDEIRSINEEIKQLTKKKLSTKNHGFS